MVYIVHTTSQRGNMPFWLCPTPAAYTPTRLSAYDGIESNKCGNMWTLKTKKPYKTANYRYKKGGLSLLLAFITEPD